MEQKLMDDSFTKNEKKSMQRHATTQTDGDQTFTEGKSNKSVQPQETLESTPVKAHIKLMLFEENLIQKRKERDQARALNDLELILEQKKE